MRRGSQVGAGVVEEEVCGSPPGELESELTRCVWEHYPAALRAHLRFVVMNLK